VRQWVAVCLPIKAEGRGRRWLCALVTHQQRADKAASKPLRASVFRPLFLLAFFAPFRRDGAWWACPLSGEENYPQVKRRCVGYLAALGWVDDVGSAREGGANDDFRAKSKDARPSWN
jgi:hypothetical protein